jgi:DNA-binding HxlR family transcriptional regulator
VKREEFLRLLRTMSKKGFYDVLNFVEEEGMVSYSDILKHCLSSKVVESRGTVPKIVDGLSDFGLIEKKVSPARPVRTSYSITQKGRDVLSNLKRIETE